MDKYYIFLLFFSNNSSNSKNLIWLLKSQAEPLFRLNHFQFERDCKGKKHFLISKHLSVFFQLSSRQELVAKLPLVSFSGCKCSDFFIPSKLFRTFFSFFLTFSWHTNSKRFNSNNLQTTQPTLALNSITKH